MLHQVLRSGFGLHTFISPQHVTEEISKLTGIPKKYSFRHWDDRQYWSLPAPELPRLHVMTAYLALRYRLIKDGLEEDDDTKDNLDFDVDETDERQHFTISSFTIFDPDMLIIDNEKKSRFGRAMNFLGLKPYMSPAQAVSLQARRDRRRLAGLDGLAPGAKNHKKLHTSAIQSLAEGMHLYTPTLIHTIVDVRNRD
jgi:hypothetical protein